MRRSSLLAAVLCCGVGAAAPARALPTERPAPEAVLTFAYGSDAPREDAQVVIAPVVVKTLAVPGNWVSLEAHADPRGSRELNLALGQRRLDALERELALQGVPVQRIRCINHGEEGFERGAQPEPRIEIRIEKIGY